MTGFSRRPLAVFVCCLFAGTQVQAGLPAGQRYFEPGQIVAPGTLVALERVTPIHRSPATRETFEHVITL